MGLRIYEHLRLLNMEFPGDRDLISSISDFPFSRAETVSETPDGRLLSDIVLYDLRYVLVAANYASGPKHSVCEIGGGNGMPAYTWLKSGKYTPNTYCIIDFPESLFMQEVFLRVNFPDLRYFYVDSAEPLSVSNYNVVFCPIHYRYALCDYPFDLVVNTGSFQEMTEDWIDNWMNWLRDGACRNFYSKNYFGQPLSYLAEGGNVHSPRLQPNWKTRYLDVNAPLIKLHTKRSYAEIIVERGAMPNENECRLAKAQYENTKGRVLSDQILLEAVDALRIHFDENDMFHLLNRCMNERIEIPKEAAFLSRQLTLTASQEFRSSNWTALELIERKLQAVRASGREGTLGD